MVNSREIKSSKSSSTSKSIMLDFSTIDVYHHPAGSRSSSLAVKQNGENSANVIVNYSGDNLPEHTGVYIKFDNVDWSTIFYFGRLAFKISCHGDLIQNTISIQLKSGIKPDRIKSYRVNLLEGVQTVEIPLHYFSPDKAYFQSVTELVIVFNSGIFRGNAEIDISNAAIEVNSESIPADIILPEHINKNDTINPDTIIMENSTDYALVGNTFLFITATDIETTALFSAMDPLTNNKIDKIAEGNHTYHIGRLGYYPVIHVQCNDMGAINPNAAMLTAYDAINLWKPVAVVVFGIAFGIDETKQRIGDVLVSRSVIDYESFRIGENDNENRTHNVFSGSILFDRFRNARSWNHYIVKNRKAKPIFGDTLSGEKLIDNAEFLSRLKADFPTAIGGDMETYGVYAACRNAGISEWIMVKGICDWADGTKATNKKNRQMQAAKSAASFCQAVFSERVFDLLFSNGNSDVIQKRGNHRRKPDIIFSSFVNNSDVHGSVNVTCILHNNDERDAVITKLAIETTDYAVDETPHFEFSGNSIEDAFVVEVINNGWSTADKYTYKLILDFSRYGSDYNLNDCIVDPELLKVFVSQIKSGEKKELFRVRREWFVPSFLPSDIPLYIEVQYENSQNNHNGQDYIDIKKVNHDDDDYKNQTESFFDFLLTANEYFIIDDPIPLAPIFPDTLYEVFVNDNTHLNHLAPRSVKAGGGVDCFCLQVYSDRTCSFNLLLKITDDLSNTFSSETIPIVITRYVDTELPDEVRKRYRSAVLGVKQLY